MITEHETCTGCDVVMVDDWNLAPIEGDKITIKETDQHGNTYLIERDAERIYKDNVYLCDECYDHWCTKQNIQPLEGEWRSLVELCMDKSKQITELIDKKLSELSGRDLVSVSEMTDFLLDIRLYLMIETESSTTV